MSDYHVSAMREVGSVFPFQIIFLEAIIWLLLMSSQMKNQQKCFISVIEMASYEFGLSILTRWVLRRRKKKKKKASAKQAFPQQVHKMNTVKILNIQMWDNYQRSNLALTRQSTGFMSVHQFNSLFVFDKIHKSHLHQCALHSLHSSRPSKQHRKFL